MSLTDERIEEIADAHHHLSGSGEEYFEYVEFAKAILAEVGKGEPVSTVLVKTITGKVIETLPARDYYTTPQPCPKCREWENKYLMEQAVNAGDGVLISENERLKAKIADLEALVTVENQKRQQLESEIILKESK